MEPTSSPCASSILNRSSRHTSDSASVSAVGSYRIGRRTSAFSPLIVAREASNAESRGMTGRIEPGGRPFPMDDFGQHQADAYLAARRSGKVQPDDHRAAGSPRDGTLRNEFLALSAVCNWAVVFKVNGRRLLAHNPVR